jgi:hypothetical protein
MPPWLDLGEFSDTDRLHRAHVVGSPDQMVLYRHQMVFSHLPLTTLDGDVAVSLNPKE